MDNVIVEGELKTVRFKDRNTELTFSLEKGDDFIFVGEMISKGKDLLAMSIHMDLSWFDEYWKCVKVLCHNQKRVFYKTPMGHRFYFSYNDFQSLMKFINDNR